MNNRREKSQDALPVQPQISEQDILEAMKGLSGYVDITPADFKEIFTLAFQKAVQRLGLSLRAKDLMTTPVVSVPAEATLARVAQVMAQAGVSGVPVLDGQGRVLGVISEKDFLKRMDPEGGKGFMGVVARCLGSGGCLVAPMLAEGAAQAMSAPALTVGAEATLAEVAELFATRGVNRAPVVDDQGRLLGMVSRGDLLGPWAGRRP